MTRGVKWREFEEMHEEVSEERILGHLGFYLDIQEDNLSMFNTLAERGVIQIVSPIRNGERTAYIFVGLLNNSDTVPADRIDDFITRYVRTGFIKRKMYKDYQKPFAVFAGIKSEGGE